MAELHTSPLLTSRAAREGVGCARFLTVNLEQAPTCGLHTFR